MAKKSKYDKNALSLKEIEFRDLLIGARRSKFNERDLVETLEDTGSYAQYFDNFQYQTFCEAYIIELINEGVFDKYKREILLASFGFLEGYYDLDITERRSTYAEQGAGLNILVDPLWKNPISSISDIEDNAIIELIKYLNKKGVLDSEHIGKLGLASKVVDKLSKDYPNGLPEKYPLQNPQYTLIPVEEIHPTDFDIKISPGEFYELKVAIIPGRSYNAPLLYLSENPEILTVSPKGVLSVTDETVALEYIQKTDAVIKERVGTQVTNVTIRSKHNNDKFAKKPVTVIFPNEEHKDQAVENTNNIIEDFKVEQHVRIIGGEKKWSNYVNAKIGDIVEFRISYKNISASDTQRQVAIKDILPKSLKYVSDTTKLTNATYPNGTVLNPGEAIVANGINIGDYTAGSNAYIYLRAQVVEDGLACGVNTLFNWSQCGIGNITIQDYSIVSVVR